MGNRRSRFLVVVVAAAAAVTELQSVRSEALDFHTAHTTRTEVDAGRDEMESLRLERLRRDPATRLHA